MVARVERSGKIGWSADTRIGKLDQVFPDRAYVVFIGTRPAAAGKVPEPIVVSVDNQSGRVSTSTLWK